MNALSDLAVTSDNLVVADILSVATQEFAQFGLGGARLERIVAQTRTSKRMIYYHFKSKEGLYVAVLERAFTRAREHETTFDPAQGTPLDALERFVQMVYDAFLASPDFVRLLTHENLSGAPYVKQSTVLSELNQRGLKLLTLVIERGKKSGTFRPSIKPLDVYFNIIGMSYYHVANRAGYLAGFAGDIGKTMGQEPFDELRRKVLVDSVRRYVTADLP